LKYECSLSPGDSGLAVGARELRRAEAVGQAADGQALIVVLARVRTAHEAHVAELAHVARRARAVAVQVERVLVACGAVLARTRRAELHALGAERARPRRRAQAVDARVVVLTGGAVPADARHARVARHGRRRGRRRRGRRAQRGRGARGASRGRGACRSGASGRCGRGGRHGEAECARREGDRVGRGRRELTARAYVAEHAREARQACAKGQVLTKLSARATFRTEKKNLRSIYSAFSKCSTKRQSLFYYQQNCEIKNLYF
jgi:hypothetical protein